MRILEHCGGRAVAGELALEIEVEGANLPRINDKWWRSEDDGSLKGEGVEYVMKAPQDLDKLIEALSDLEERFKVQGSRVDESFRAGIHVHVNVQELSFKQVMTLACCYLIVEEVLVDYCHPSRAGNHFCYRAIDAGGLVKALYDFTATGNIRYINTDNIRYSAMNFTSLFKYGSLEFRALESTKDYKKVVNWAGVLRQIKRASMKYANPREVYKAFDELGPREFARQLLGGYADKFLVGEYEQKILDGMEVSIEIAYAREWGIDLNIFNPQSSIFG